MSRTLPTNGRWQSAQNGDTFGDLIRSKNMSLDKDGLLQLARKTLALYSHDDDAGFGSPTCVETDGTYLYVATSSGHFFVIDLTSNSFSITETSSSNGPTLGDDSDMVIFNSLPHVSGGAKVNYVNAVGQGQNWHNSAPIPDLSTSFPHPLCVRERAATLLVGDGNVVRQYSTGYVRDTANELTIPSQYIVVWIRTNGADTFVGTRHRYGGMAKVFKWNGAGVSNQAEYPIGADWAYSADIYQSVLTIITSAGEVKSFNGGGFTQIAALPVYYTPYSWTSTAADTSLIGRVASRGMRAAGDKLYINIDGSINNPATSAPGRYLPDQPSGLWVLTPANGLAHKAGYQHKSKILNLITGLNSSYLNFAIAHQCEIGDPVLYVGSLTGLTSGQVYYAIPDGPTGLRLALTPQDAVAGKALTITGTPSTDRCYFDRHESQGATAISSPGGVCAFGKNSLNQFYGSEVVFGGAALDETLSGKGVLMSLGVGRNRGSFATPRIDSAGILDFIQQAALRFASLALATDGIIVKSRIRRRAGFPTRPIRLTWTGASTFSVDTMAYDFSQVQEGDELEIVGGAAGGYTAHITDIDRASSVFVVTVDEALPVSNGDLSLAFVDNWEKRTLLTKDSENNAAGFHVQGIGGQSPSAQLKFELRGVGIAINAVQFIQASSKSV